MNIKKYFIVCDAQLANIGGNCLVAELPIMDGGDLKLVTINNDCIVGRSADEASYENKTDELFVVESWLELCKIVGCYKAAVIYDKFKYRWHDNCRILDEDKMKAVKRLMEFTDAASLLVDCWNHDVLDDSCYPFKESFDELSSKIFDWQFNIINKIESN